MTHRRLRLVDDGGFTIIEVMVAAAVLLGGMLGLLLLFNNAWDASYSAKAREQGVALQRELIEATRAIPFDQLTNTGVVARLQGTAGAGLGDQGASAGWDIRRRTTTYHVAVGVCTVDDPGDGLGVHDDTFCATGAGATSAATCRTMLGRTGSIQGTASASGAAAGDCGIDKTLDGTVDSLTTAEVACTGSGCGGTADANPADYKRIVTLVRWDRGTGYRYALQSATVSNPGTAGAPGVTDIVALPATVTSAATTSVQVTATFSQTPKSATWYLDGTAKDTVVTSGPTWVFTWPLGTVSLTATPNAGEVLDGSYTVSAKGFDTYGGYNGTRAVTVQLDRRKPYPPPGFEAGLNNGVGELEWGRNKERDVVAYRIYRRTGSSAWVQLYEGNDTHYLDTVPAGPTTFDYYMVALDKNGEGDPTAIDTVKTTNNAPTTPSITSSSKTATTATLTWTAATDPDAGDSVDFYRIYRDGTSYADRYDRTGTGAQTTYTDPNTSGLQHTYVVVAVDTGLQESGKSNAVTP